MPKSYRPGPGSYPTSGSLGDLLKTVISKLIVSSCGNKCLTPKQLPQVFLDDKLMNLVVYAIVKCKNEL